MTKYDVLYNMDRIMDEFDFRRVHDFMKKSEWTWVGDGTNHECRVPTVKEMRKVAKHLLRTCVQKWIENHHKLSTGTGGFYASISKKGRLKLSFIVEEMSSYDIAEMEDTEDMDDIDYADYADYED